MSLFEKLNNKRYNLQEKKIDRPLVSGSPGMGGEQEGFTKANNRKISKRMSQSSSKKLDNQISARRSAETTRSDAINRALGGTSSTEGTGGANTGTATYKPPSKKKQLEIQNRSTLNKLQKGQGVNVGTPKITGDVIPTTKVKQSEVSKAAKEFTDKINKQNKNRRKGVDYFFDADEAKKQRDAFQAGRKAYTTSKTGIKAGTPTKQGIINYIAKARTMRQGSNASVKANKKAAEIIYKSSGQKYADKIRKKYETDKNLPRRRPSNAPTYAQVKAKIDAKEKAMQAKNTVLKVAEKGKKGTSAFPGFDEIPKKSTEGRRIAKQFATAKQLTGEPTKPLTRFQKIKKAVTTGWKIPKDTGNFIEKTRGAGKNITKTLTRKSYKPNLVGTIAKNLDKVPNRYKAIAAAGLIGYGLIGRNKTAKADANAGAGAATPKKKIMKYTTGTTTLKLGGKTNPNPIKGRAPGYDF